MEPPRTHGDGEHRAWGQGFSPRVTINEARGDVGNIASVETVCSRQTVARTCDTVKGHPERLIFPANCIGKACAAMMMKPFSLKSWRWSDGGLLVLVSIGLHSLLLAMPTPKASTPPEAVMTLASSRDNASPEIRTAETIDVVRLPQPTNSPPPPEATPSTPLRPNPTSSAPAPAAQRVLPQPSIPDPPEAERPATERLAPERPGTEHSEPERPASNPAPPEPEPEPIPPGLVHNNKAIELVTDTRDFLTWYLSQNWEGFALEPLPAPTELPTLQVPYRGEVCLTIPPAPGRLEVILGSDGQLSRAPRLLATTGYDDLDAAALALAAQQNFSEAANPIEPNPMVYWLPMEVLYQGPNCPPN